MSLTLAEITAHQKRLRQEIMERECLLAAFNVLHGYAARGDNPTTLDLASLISAVPSTPPAALELAAPAPALPAPPPPPPRYIHPDLTQYRFTGHGGDSEAVRWAIKRMTGDFSLTDVAALLEREGRRMMNSQISVVLTRLKRRGQIEEVECSAGPNPAVFRRPDWALPLEEITAAQNNPAAAETIPAAA